MVRGLRHAFLFLALTGLTSCHVIRYFTWNYADIHDQERFPAVPVHHADQNFQFTPLRENPGIGLRSFQDLEASSFEELISGNGTVAFLMIRNDSVIYENYFREYTPSSLLPSFSVSKSFVSALTALAIAEGKIGSTSDTLGRYLPDLESAGVKRISLEDLLNMRAGLHFHESYGNPFTLMPKFYYGTSLRKYAMKLKTEYPPGTRYEYQSASTVLLGLAIEKATGMPLNRYLEENIWKPLGMETDASWSIDSKKGATIKSFCCLNACARDFARFGRLYLEKGRWQGKQIVPEEWVDRSFTVMNDSKDSQGYPYTYSWRIMPSGAVFAKGILGQYIYINRSKKIVIVRLGAGTGKINWPVFFEELVNQL